MVSSVGRAGHEVVPFEAPPMREAMNVFFGIFFGVGGHLMWDHALRVYTISITFYPTRNESITVFYYVVG